jgi:hypothetical protein
MKQAKPKRIQCNGTTKKGIKCKILCTRKYCRHHCWNVKKYSKNLKNK